MSPTCAATPGAPPTGQEVLESLTFFLPKKGESVAIIGVSQNGKTTLAFHWAAALQRAGVRSLAWDPDWQWSEALRPTHGEREYGPMARSVTVEELERDSDLLLDRNLSLAVRPTDRWAPDAQIAEEFARFAWMVIRAHPGGRLALWIDECHILRASDEAMALLDAMALRWGKEGPVPFLITQRWTHLSADVRAEVAWLISFHQNKPSDLRQMRMDAGKLMADAVGDLEPFQYRVRFLRKRLKDATEAA